MSTPEVHGYQAVRLAARNYDAFSSDLLGEQDVRTYRQLPLEVDPPAHAMYRDALQPFFMGAAVSVHTEAFERIARRLIQRLNALGGGNVPRDIALPFTMGCLAEVYRRPQDLDEWVSWGPEVWLAEAYAAGDDRHSAPRSAATLQAYLDRVLSAAYQRAEDGEGPADIWDNVVRLDLERRVPTMEESYGIANLLLAGGRDTVIKVITGIVWHLIQSPADRDFLTETPTAHARAIAEFVRYLSPLRKIERVQKQHIDGVETGAELGEHVLLNFASANHDPTAWTTPSELDIHRPRQPHLGFGFGRHSCMGMNVAEIEIKAFLRVLLAEWPRWEFDGDPQIEWVTEAGARVLDRFDALRVTLT